MSEDNTQGESQGAVQDGAPPTEPHKDGEFKPPKDGSWLPRDRVKEMIATAVKKAKDEFSAQIEERTKAQKDAEAVKPAQQYTRAQLSEFVEAGRLTQEAADSIYERQIEDRATRKAVEEATKAVASQHQQLSVAERMAEFQGLVPDAWEEGTPEREQVAAAYAALKATGIKGTKDELELAALIAAFGEPAKIRKARGLGRSGPSESFEDSGSSGGRRRQGSDGDEEGIPRGITPKQREHYEKGIAAGRYKGWADVREELKYARTAKRA